MNKKTPPYGLIFPKTMLDHHHGIESIFTADDIAGRVNALADQLCPHFEGEPVAQVIMNGAMVFAADLCRALSMRGLVLEMDFIQLHKNRREGSVDLIAASNRPVEGRDVLVIDDIFETGRTLSFAYDHFKKLGAKSVTSVVLLDKSQGRETEVKAHFRAFDCPDVFIVGYGMDLGFRYRELPFIGRLGQA